MAMAAFIPMELCLVCYVYKMLKRSIPTTAALCYPPSED